MATFVRKLEPAPVREIGAVPDDSELVIRALDGDSWAKEALYRRHVRRVTDTVSRVLGRNTEAEDVVQETFLKVFSRLGSLRDPTLFERWLMRIAMNKVRGRLRKRKLLRTLGLDRSVDDATLERFAVAGAPADVRAELGRIDRALGDVSPAHRMAWMLHVVEGFSLPETADACDCSLATAKRWIRKAKDRIEAHIAEGDAS